MHMCVYYVVYALCMCWCTLTERPEEDFKGPALHLITLGKVLVKAASLRTPWLRSQSTHNHAQLLPQH